MPFWQWLTQWRFTRHVLGTQVATASDFDREPHPPAIPGHRYRVTREHLGFSWVLYDGTSGANARRRFEHVKAVKEPGVMEFYQDGVCRDRYERLP